MSFDEYQWIRDAVRDAISTKKTSQRSDLGLSVERVMAKKKQPPEVTLEQADSAKTQLMPRKRCGLMVRNCEPFVSAINLMDMADAEPPLENGYRLKYADETTRIWLHSDALFVQIESKIDGRWTVVECYQ